MAAFKTINATKKRADTTEEDEGATQSKRLWINETIAELFRLLNH